MTESAASLLDTFLLAAGLVFLAVSIALKAPKV